jgi:hypothetical protein
MRATATVWVGVISLASLIASAWAREDKPTTLPKAFVDGEGTGWKALGEKDFANVNCADTTWAWRPDALYCTGKPVGVLRSARPYTNFELVLEWKHEKRSGNSGVFVWTPKESLDALKPDGRDRLPSGIEVQILDHGYTEDYEKAAKKKATWFTTNGDVFRVGKSKFQPFEPKSPDGSRSFPRKNTTRGFGEWNHYYIRAINGEVRLWVNGEEVSGGQGADPRTGYLCLESEGSPIQFRNLRLRELP